jgi:serine/threonine-protein kinase
MTAPTSSESIEIGVKPGDVLAGKYRVAHVLGVGGMGVIVAAHHIQLDAKVALKFLLPSALRNAEAVARFEREARAAVKIKSEHVARVSDVGKLDNGSPYMVMEYLEGTDLAGMLEKRKSLPIEEAVEFVLQACEALAEAHVLGIVHRDLKPANLFCIRRADGRMSIKVLDFGISKLTAPGQDVSMTRTTAIMGSPLYMSPEQMQSSKRVDARSDIWALGVILFELVTGRPPFDADAVTELIIKIATAQPVAMGSIRADVPAGLERLIMRCLEKDAERRFRNIGEFALALETFGPKRARASIDRILGTMEAAGMSALPASSGGIAPSDLGSTQAPVQATPGTVGSWGTTGPGPLQGKRAIVGAAIGGGLLVLVGGVLLLAKKGAAPDAHPSTASAAMVASQPPLTSPPPALSLAPALDSTAPASLPVAPVAVVPTALANPAPSPTATTATRSARPAAVAHSAPAAEAPPHPAAKVNCTPPYYYDANGTRVFKKECL